MFLLAYIMWCFSNYYCFCLVVAFLFEVLLHWKCTNMCVLFLLKSLTWCLCFSCVCVHECVCIWMSWAAYMISNANIRGRCLRWSYPFERIYVDSSINSFFLINWLCKIRLWFFYHPVLGLALTYSDTMKCCFLLVSFSPL